MIKVDICGSEKLFEDISDSWIYEQILNRKNHGIAVWIKVTIHHGPIMIGLSTSNCPPSKPSNRHPNRQEQEVFDLWDSLGLNNGDVNTNQLLKFFHKIKSFL